MPGPPLLPPELRGKNEGEQKGRDPIQEQWGTTGTPGAGARNRLACGSCWGNTVRWVTSETFKGCAAIRSLEGR